MTFCEQSCVMLQAQTMQGFRSLQGLWPRARCCLWALRDPVCRPRRQVSAWSLLAYEDPMPGMSPQFFLWRFRELAFGNIVTLSGITQDGSC